MSLSHLASGLAGLVLGASLREQAEPAFSAIAGGAGVGTALACAWEIRKDEPRWDEAMGRGAAGGALAGAGLLVSEMAGLL